MGRTKGSTNKERNAKIRALAAENYSNADIAILLGMRPSNVYNILNPEKSGKSRDYDQENNWPTWGPTDNVYAYILGYPLGAVTAGWSRKGGYDQSQKQGKVLRAGSR